MGSSLAELEALLPAPLVDILSPPWAEATGFSFPSDYRDFAARYGFGDIESDGSPLVLYIGGPTIVEPWPEPIGFDGFVAEGALSFPLDTYVGNDAYTHPFSPFPEPGSFFQFGGSDAGDMFLWYVTGPDPESWPVLAWSASDGNSYRTEGGMLAFLVALVRGDHEMSRELLGDHPRWTAWYDWTRSGLEASTGPAQPD